MNNPEIKQRILKNSISLKQYGLNELAWSKSEALQLITSLMNEHIGILGGDVYQISNKQLRPVYENWWCEQSEKETTSEYHLRSKIESKEYINDYPTNSSEQIIFSITFTEKIEF